MTLLDHLKILKLLTDIILICAIIIEREKNKDLVLSG